LDHGTVFLKWSDQRCASVPGVAPGFPACDAGVILLDHDPKAEDDQAALGART